MIPLLKDYRLRLLTPLALLVLSGCASFDADKARREQTDSFTQHLAEQQQALLTRSLSLDDCIGIAITNNYAARKADVDLAIQRVAKNVAFTAFLPNLDLNAAYLVNNKQPNIMSEKRYGQANLEASVPIFMPSAWFLYAATRHGYAAAELSANYVRQTISLEASQAYYQVLVLHDTVVALESQLAAARENAQRLAGFAAEGFLTEWEMNQAALLAETREAELNAARRSLILARSNLLVTLGLSPLVAIANNGDFTLSGDVGELERPQETLAEMVIQTLETHPLLSIADRQVVIQEHAVRQAFTGFLPVINFSTSASWTGNDLADHATIWTSAFGGAWKLFSGFANTARYKAAKLERRRSELERESTFLNLIVQVVAAESAARDAAEATDIARRSHEVARSKHADYEAKAREGLLPASEALDARAAMDAAQVALVRMRYQERIALAALDLARGRALASRDATQDEAQDQAQIQNEAQDESNQSN